MSVDKRETAADSRLQALDEELRQTKAALHKVEHELEQALTQIWNLEAGLHKLEQSIGESGDAVNVLPGIHEEMRQLRGQVDRVQERQNLLVGRAEELARQQQTEVERERQERANLTAQSEAAARSVDQFESRAQRLEESLRHVDEAVAESRLSHQALAREIEELSSRSARNLEAALRLEHQLDALATGIQALEKGDNDLAEKLALFEDRVDRQTERVNKFEDQLGVTLQIKEQLNRAQFERQQMSERLGKLETSVGGLIERTAEFVQGLARVEKRSQHQAQRLLELAEQLRQQGQTVSDQMQRLVRTIERQRRRQAEALAEEIKELSRGEFKPEQ